MSCAFNKRLSPIHADKELGAFPAHQPVLDPPELKQHYDAFMTTSMEAYRPPNKQTDSESK